MTQLPNRNYFYETLFKLFTQPSAKAAVFFLDINNFNQINNQFGHLTGDNILRDSSHCLIQLLPSHAFVARLGGDEFAVIITENPNQVEELIHSFDSNVANWHGKFVDSMTVSYGWVFSTERNWGSAYEISKAADARMYQSKERYYKESGADRR